jgi:hypothetical protein
MTLLGAVGWLLASHSTTAQVLWDIDFDTSTDLLYWNTTSIYYSGGGTIPPPVITSATVNTGEPAHQNALRFSVDASANTDHYYSAWQAIPVAETVATYDPQHTFLSFDLLVYQLRPVHAKIYYCGWLNNIRNLEIDAIPTVTGSFQRFTLPLSSFTVTWFSDTPPNNPTTFEFGIRGDAAHPDTTWPFAPTNVFLLDNILYTVSPTLSITNSGTNLILWWPTNASSFTLQQNLDAASPDWLPVTNSPVKTNGQNQVLVAPVTGRHFYRLVGP